MYLTPQSLTNVVSLVNLKNKLAELNRHLSYNFQNIDLLAAALTHRSAASTNNERLEFLGDSILNFVAAEALFVRFPKLKEGELSRLRANLVKGETLANIARELNLGDFLILGEGELKSGGFRRSSILADCVEAIIGAVYLDSDMLSAKMFVLDLYQSRLDDPSLAQSTKDPKTELQEWLQARKQPLPQYSVVNVGGEDHCQSFTVKCEVALLDEAVIAKGNSRRKAEKLAAENALSFLKGQNNV